MIARLLALLAFFAVSSEAFVAPASPALSVSVVARQPAATMLGGGKGKPKKAAKKVVKKVAKKPVKKVAKKAAKKAAPKGAFRPGQQMPANQAVTELFGGFFNAFDLLRNLPK